MMAAPASIGVSAPVRARLPLGVADGAGAGVVASGVGESDGAGVLGSSVGTVHSLSVPVSQSCRTIGARIGEPSRVSPVRVPLMLKEKLEFAGMWAIVTVMVLPSSLTLMSPRPSTVFVKPLPWSAPAPGLEIVLIVEASNFRPWTALIVSVALVRSLWVAPYRRRVRESPTFGSVPVATNQPSALASPHLGSSEPQEPAYLERSLMSRE